MAHLGAPPTAPPHHTPAPGSRVILGVPSSVLVVASAVALSLPGDSMLYTVLPSRAESVGLTVGLLGVILSANRFIRLLANTWAGRVCERWGRPIPFVAALVVGAAITVGYGLIWGFPAFLLTRMLWGICWSFLRLENYQTVYDASGRANVGRIMGSAQALVRSGMLAGALFGGVLTDLIGFRTTLFAFAGVGVLGAALGARHMRLQHPRYHPAYDPPPAPEDSGAIPATATGAPFSLDPTVLKARRRAVCWTGFCTRFAVMSIVVATLGRLLAVRFGANVSILGITLGVASLTGFLLAGRSAVMLMLIPALGHMSDRVGRGRMIVVALLAAVAGHILLASAGQVSVVCLAIFVLSLAAAAVSPTLDATAGTLATLRERARFVSRYVTFLDLGAACGPLIGLPIAGAFGLHSTYYLSVAVVGSGLIVYVFAFLPRRSEAASAT